MIVYEDPSGAATELWRQRSASGSSGSVSFAGSAGRGCPHVTVLRFKERAGLTPEVTNIRSFRAVRTALYSSTLRPGGAQYEALETAALGGR